MSISLRGVGAVAVGGRRSVILLSLGALWGCAGDAGNATAPTDVNANVAVLTVSAPSVPLLAGETTRLEAEARDEGGRIVAGATVSWHVSNEALARVDADGRLVAVGHGTVTVTASAGRAQAIAPVDVRLTSESQRFAYALVDEPSASTSYSPNATHQYNATGGNTVVRHNGVGEYVVSFERLAKVDSTFRETVLVTPYGNSGERCHLNGWGDASNRRDLEVSVSCYGFGGAKVDARFSVLVVGSHTLASRSGFTVVGDAASSFAPQADHTYASFADHVGISRSTAGSFLVQMNAAADETPQSYFVSTYGGPSDLCKIASWNQGVWASVICYAPTGALSDARFSLLMVESGRPGRRFGFAWANQPSASLGEPYTASEQYQHTSSGQPVRIAREAVGVYRVSFPGLARVGNRSETVQVSPYGGGLFNCQVQGSGNSPDGSALDATVRCWNRTSGTPADSYFTVLVLE